MRADRPTATLLLLLLLPAALAQPCAANHQRTITVQTSPASSKRRIVFGGTITAENTDACAQFCECKAESCEECKTDANKPILTGPYKGGKSPQSQGPKT